MTVIDTNSNVSAHLDELKARGVTAVGRYFASKAWKRVTKPEAEAISEAGIKLFVVFEDSGDPALTAESGIHDAQIALAQAKAIGQPVGSTIYFALEHLPDGYKKKHVKGAKEYIGGVRSVIAPKFKVGVYSNGVICDALLTAGLCEHAWLSASLSFEGSQDFLASGKWSLAQSSEIDQDWNGLSIDVNQSKPEFGAFFIGEPGAASAEAANTMSPANAAAPQPVSGFAGRAMTIASEQGTFFGRQTYDLNGHQDHLGHKEGENGWYQRVGDYWLEGTNTSGVDGQDHGMPWSAAFISWVMKQAGALSRFRYSTQHSVYISQGIRDYLKQRQEAGYWTQRLNEAKPEVGDLVCWGREAGVDYDHQKDGNYKGHTDLVVEVAGDRIWVIGGNVGNSVTRRPLRLDASGYLSPIVSNGENLFGLMKNRIA